MIDKQNNTEKTKNESKLQECHDFDEGVIIEQDSLKVSKKREVLSYVIMSVVIILIFVAAFFYGRYCNMHDLEYLMNQNLTEKAIQLVNENPDKKEEFSDDIKYYLNRMVDSYIYDEISTDEFVEKYTILSKMNLNDDLNKKIDAIPVLVEQKSTYNKAVDLYNDKKYSESIELLFSMELEMEMALKVKVNTLILDSNKEIAKQQYDSYVKEEDYLAAALCLKMYDIYDEQSDLSNEYLDISEKIEQNEISHFYKQSKVDENKNIVYYATPCAVLDLDDVPYFDGMGWLNTFSIFYNYRADLNVLPQIKIDEKSGESSFILGQRGKLEGEDEATIKLVANEAMKYSVIDIVHNKVLSEFAEDTLIYPLYGGENK